jgi:hypothetical protein
MTTFIVLTIPIIFIVFLFAFILNRPIPEAAVSFRVSQVGV